jgi:1-deoxyxylulose-5-phosphate synthase
MEYVRLGSTGVKVSRLCLGCMSFGNSYEWMIDEAASRPIMKQALEAGINFFDTADVYSRGVSEEITGRALKDFGPGRDRVVIATKVYFPMGDDPNQKGLSRKHIMHAIDESLRRLGTDYVDLYQIHRFDPETPVEETLQALSDVIKAGKVRYIGASSMYAWQLAKLLYTADRLGLARFVTMQNHYNLIYREEEREMIPFCRDQGIGLIPWSPLAGGILLGNRRRNTARSKGPITRDRYLRKEDDAMVDVLAQVAERRGEKPAVTALAWILSKAGVVAPIVGAYKPNHLEDAVKAVETKLAPEDMAALEAPYAPQGIMGHV